MAFQKKQINSSIFTSDATAEQHKMRRWLYLTAALLLLGFILLIAFVFVFAAIFPSLFGKCIAVVEINKQLTTEGIPSSIFYEGEPSSQDIAHAIKELEKRDDVAAVVFVINSPGGSVIATHDVYDAIKNLSKPKVAYFKELATSGAYYISTATDYIISDPDAITGSIGVVATFMDMSGLFEKIGLNVTAVKSGAHKDIGSSARPLTEEEKTIIQSIINEVFDEFKSVILKHRGDKLNKEKFQQILDGRIVTGKQAKEIGLVDELGKEDDAINKAAELAGIEKESRICKISTMPHENQLFNLGGFVKYFIEEKARLKISYE